MNKILKSEFRNTPMGFAMTFENGWTISVQWGPGNYCHRQDRNDNPFDGIFHDYISPTAEIAAWDKDGKWTKLSSHDDVKGWLSVNDVYEYMSMIAHPEFAGMDWSVDDYAT